MAWREEIREQRREKILEVAAAVFARKGYEQATVKEIAGEIGIAPGTIYLYFENKRDLLLAIADRLLAETMDRQLTELGDVSEETLLSELLRERLRFASENQAFVQAMVTAVWTDDEIRERFFGGIIAPLFAVLGGYLQARVERGDLRPCRADVVVPAMAGAFFMLGILRTAAPGVVLADVPDKEMVDELVGLYLDGLRPRPEGIEQR